jgi:hypothetical protein
LTDDDQHDVGAPSRRDQLRLERGPAVERHCVEEDATFAEPVDERCPEQCGREGLVGPAVAEEGRRGRGHGDVVGRWLLPVTG